MPRTAAPSVGLMQPWRFLRITDRSLREQIHRLVEEERRRTAEALGTRQDEFMRLKVQGVLECGELLVAALCEGREQHIFGRRTLPEMDLASVSCAIQNLWLAARAEGLGMGWVSLFDPLALAQLLHMPEGSLPIAVLCLGHVDAVLSRPDARADRLGQGAPLERISCSSTAGTAARLRIERRPRRRKYDLPAVARVCACSSEPGNGRSSSKAL